MDRDTARLRDPLQRQVAAVVRPFIVPGVIANSQECCVSGGACRCRVRSFPSSMRAGFACRHMPHSQYATCDLRNALLCICREGDEEIDLSWGLGPWSRQAGSKASSASAIDRVRGQLRDDFYTALRHAYLGPALTDLQRGQFPDCFEGDERSTLDTADVLQLVSGRQLLGVVRERRPEALAGEDATAPQFLNAGGNSGPGTAGRDVRGTTTAPGEGPEQAWQSTGGAEAGAEQAASGSKPRPKDDLVLDLILEDNIIASAVKHVEARAISAAEGSTHSVCLASFYKNGSLMAQLLRESEEGEAEQPLNGEMNPKPKKTSALSSQSHVTKLACTNAGPTYTVLRANTPLVRHLSFVAELAGSGGGGGAATPSSTPFTRGMKGGSVCVARAHRAWLPPSSLWLFQPRSYCHDIGGWTFTWAGHANEGHPAWLDPALVVLVAALHTVEHEEAARQPQGVFARARQGDETEGGVLAWVRAMLRFHRRPEQ